MYTYEEGYTEAKTNTEKISLENTRNLSLVSMIKFNILGTGYGQHPTLEKESQY